MRIDKVGKGEKWYYEGTKEHEYLVRIEKIINRDEWYNYHFQGVQGFERLVRGESSTGEVHFYEGDRNHEHLCRATFPNEPGKTYHYTGEKGSERLRKVESSDVILFYEGERGEEYTVGAAYLAAKAA